ncbi:hypothetical protein OAO87_03940, partial [bacterium]|nr:hypothetical protein [bacterium]
MQPQSASSQRHSAARYYASRPSASEHRLCPTMASPRMLSLLLHIAGAVPWASLHCVPDGLLSNSTLDLFSSSVRSLRAAARVRATFSRHGGMHRSTDHPMGGLLVRPLHERRVRVEDGFRAHLDAAMDLPFLHDSRLRATALPGDIMMAVRKPVRLGQALPSDRAAAFAAVSSVSDSLLPMTDQLVTLMPPTVHRISSRVHVALMAAVVESLGWLDVSIACQFINGFPVVGDVPDSGVYRLLESVVSHDVMTARYHDFQSGARAWGRVQLSRLAGRSSLGGSPQRDADLAVSVKTEQERSKGVVVGPFSSLSALDASLRSASPHMPRGISPRPLDRFGIMQKGKLRAIDNGRSNGANHATLMHETVTTPSFFFVAVAARAYVEAATSLGRAVPATYTALADLAMAYRTVPTSQPWYTSIAFYDPRAAPPGPRYYYLPGHNFGLLSAVVNFNRFPELVVVAVRAFCALAIDHYYDDFILVDIDPGGSGLRCLQAFVSAFGRGPRPRSSRIRSPELDPDKTQVTATSNVVLGVLADTSEVLTSSQVRFDPLPDRISRILHDFRAAFNRGVLTSGEAASLRGRLQFCLSAAYGSVGRAATLPLVQRQYRDTSDAFTSSSELHHCLLFFEALLPRLPPLVVSLSFDTTPPIVVYSDAAFWLRKARRGDLCSADRTSR